MPSGESIGDAGPLAGIRIAESGGRLAGRLCADLLCRHGASRVDLADATRDSPADVVIVSSRSGTDTDPEFLPAAADGREPIVCAISPYGLNPGEVPVADPSELQLQAVTGLMATTGEAGGPPVGICVPLIEAFAALNAATAILAALRIVRGGGRGQLIDISLFDAAIGLHGSFLGKLHDGAARGLRGGCRHPICAPWNAYPASDGWIIICSVTDEHWQRLLRSMGRTDLSKDRRFASTRARVENVHAVDGIVAAWTRGRTKQGLVSELSALGIPAGSVADPAALTARGEPLPCRWHMFSAGAERRPPATAVSRPLEGVSILEIGPYTAGPLAGRLLSNIGADTVKAEPPGGEVSRDWLPRVGGASLYFTNYNAGKRSVMLDLRAEGAREALTALAGRADVMIQNMRPGQLVALGCGPEALLTGTGLRVYCSISGFGGTGPALPAVDTVVQAEGGLVARIPSTGAPVKAGPSVADLIAAHWAALEILAALLESERTGRRVFLDVSMVDCIAWLCTLTGPDADPMRHCVLAASDGWVLAEGVTADDPRGLGEMAQGSSSAAAIVRRLGEAGIQATRVLELDEAFALPLIGRRGLLRGEAAGRLVAGHVLAAPLGLTGTPPFHGTTAPALEANRKGKVLNG